MNFTWSHYDSSCTQDYWTGISMECGPKLTWLDLLTLLFHSMYYPLMYHPWPFSALLLAPLPTLRNPQNFLISFHPLLHPLHQRP